MSENNLRNMVGFSLDKKQNVVEFLPKNEQFKSKEKRRAIFFNLYNYYVDTEMQLSKDEIRNGRHIYEVFINKINKEEKSKVLQKKFKNLIKFGSHSELFFDIDDMFLHLVYERSKKVNPHANVILLEKSILIEYPRDASSTLLIPSYLKLERESIASHPKIKGQMQEACRILNKGEKIKQVYLIYPKHPSFMKYITVNLQDRVQLVNKNYRVKMIPYSFSFCTKNACIKSINKQKIGDNRCQ